MAQQREGVAQKGKHSKSPGQGLTEAQAASHPLQLTVLYEAQRQLWFAHPDRSAGCDL